MENTALLPLALAGAAVAFVVTAIEMRISLGPDACPECPHCRERAAAEAAAQRELEEAYARSLGLDQNDKDDRKIG